MYPAPFNYHRPKTLAEAMRLLAGEQGREAPGGRPQPDPGHEAPGRGPGHAGGHRRPRGAVRHRRPTAGTCASARSPPTPPSPRRPTSRPAVRSWPRRRPRSATSRSATAAPSAAPWPTPIPPPTSPPSCWRSARRLAAIGPGGSRDIPVEGFFKDLFTTDLTPTEILTAIRVPTYGKGTGGAYLKHRHPASSYAVVGVAAVVTIGGGKCTKVRLVVGGRHREPGARERRREALMGQAATDDVRHRRGEGGGGPRGPAVGLLRLRRVPRPPGHRDGEASPGRGASRAMS